MLVKYPLQRSQHRAARNRSRCSVGNPDRGDCCQAPRDVVDVDHRPLAQLRLSPGSYSNGAITSITSSRRSTISINIIRRRSS